MMSPKFYLTLLSIAVVAAVVVACLGSRSRAIQRARGIILPKIYDKKEISALIDRDTAQHPVKDSLSERGCPACGAHIPWDALNEPVEHAPAFCKNCGQRFDWSSEQ